MGFFNKILVQEEKTGNLIDIVNLDKQHYESFLEAMKKLQINYKSAQKGKKTDERGWIPFEGCDTKNFSKATDKNCLIKFDDGSVLRYNDKWPMAALTHYKSN